MSTQSTDEEVTEATSKSSEASNPRSFERNEYFHGKLMTARDMRVEQDYHRDRLHTLSQHVLGSGLVCGLETDVRFDTTEGHVEACVHPGLAIDRQGRPIKVPDQQWTTAKYVGDEDDRTDDPKRIAVYLTYKECFTDAVPVPDVTNACEERCCYNRVIEQFDVTYTETKPTEHKMVPSITFPTQKEFEAYEENGAENHANPMLFEMARDFYDDDHALRCEAYGDFSLLLGIFERGEESKEYVYFEECTESDKSDKSDRRDEFDESSVDRRPFVYSNDMLYAVLARHATNYANPHEVSINEVIGVDGNITLRSKGETITVTQNPPTDESEGEGWVNLEVNPDELNELKQCVGVLTELLQLHSELIAALIELHTQSAYGQLGKRQSQNLDLFKGLRDELKKLCGPYVPEDDDDIIRKKFSDIAQEQYSVEYLAKQMVQPEMEERKPEEDEDEDASD